MNQTVQDMMRAATQLTRSGRLQDATALIQRALGASAQPAPMHREDVAPGLILDGCVFERPDARDARTGIADAPGADIDLDLETTPKAPGDGRFIAGAHTHGSLTRRYKLYIPPGRTGQALPLVVMLHGCTQDPDDFAAGTRMNALAREQGVLVLYPAQSQDANPSRCWNWFKHNHQRRGAGEAALLASMTQQVIAEHGVDRRRVYVAGLSAGGAMAAIVARAYPELYAAVGVHSGLAPGAAVSLPEALAAMQGSSPKAARPAGAAAARRVPTIVFHGDMDATVHPVNGEQVLHDALDRSASDPLQAPRLHTATGSSDRGRRYTRTVAHDAAEAVIAEHWLIHGAGHAWAGGGIEGSYTDPSGPDASREMLRFFLAHPHGAVH